MYSKGEIAKRSAMYSKYSKTADHSELWDQAYLNSILPAICEADRRRRAISEQRIGELDTTMSVTPPTGNQAPSGPDDDSLSGNDRTFYEIGDLKTGDLNGEGCSFFTDPQSGETLYFTDETGRTE